MDNQNKLTVRLKRLAGPRPAPARRFAILTSLVLTTALAPMTRASENVAQAPFAYWADVPPAGQFVLGMVYEQSKSYSMYASGQQYNIKVKASGENYGIDVRQGYFALQYGINERWAADLEVGGTTVGWRSFSPGNQIQSTIGVMDTSFGARYQIFNEACELEFALDADADISRRGRAARHL